MPRWLSEGISVYEERQAGATWGQRMSPQHRKRILDGRLVSVRDLSSSFLRPEKPGDLQFAYYQSSLLVEYLIQMYGSDALKSMLDDLASGLHVNDAIERHTTSLDQIDMEFRDFAMEQARQLAPSLDWEQYDLSGIKDDDDPDRLEHWVADHPESIQGLTLLADQLVGRREYAKAKQTLNRLIELYPQQSGVNSAYATLAAIYRELGEADDERKILDRYVDQSDDARNELLRLIELQSKTGDWKAVSQSVKKLLAINPLLSQAQKARAAAAEKLGDADEAIRAMDAWLLLDPDDLADAHFRLAKLLYSTADARAKEHVLAALEVAPRFRDAQKLLLKIVRESPTAAGHDEPPQANNPQLKASGF
jgi:tetratricopeptide (TPR) repeat protein